MDDRSASHLIHVGYPKAASTYLQAWFRAHPDLRYVPGGLAGFANVQQLADHEATPYHYRVTSWEGLSAPIGRQWRETLNVPGSRGHANPVKPAQAAVCDRLRATFPGSRILIITRGFRGMIMSGYSQSLRVGATRSLSSLCQDFGALLTIDEQHHYDYDYLVGLYVNAFGEDNVVVLPFELLLEDPPRLTESIEDRLGLSHYDIAVDHFNPSLSPAELYWYPRISAVVSQASRVLGKRRGSQLLRRYHRRTINNGLAPAIAALERVAPRRRTTEDDLSADVLELCRGRAQSLQRYPEYAPYADEYLFGGA